ncbi:hypothetical protein [Pseudoalteromonas phage J2-1_QLiu-2017]|nr:hypothetical protein [Pseudoalteromonas phage J2-1_QLiu-2017]
MGQQIALALVSLMGGKVSNLNNLDSGDGSGGEVTPSSPENNGLMLASMELYDELELFDPDYTPPS